MNAAQRNQAPVAAPLVGGARGPVETGSALSALVDGELATDELDALLQVLAEDVDARQACQRFALIGDVLRSGAVAPAGQPPHVFAAGVRARLQAEQAPAPVRQPSAPAPQRHMPAANDAVFRWKLVAGFASLAAVMAVSWGVLGASGDRLSTEGPQLAQAVPAAPSVVASAEPAVLVNTPRGPVLRDPRLEQLLSEHRQFGGMSALQMPAGFLRDATHQSDAQR